MTVVDVEGDGARAFLRRLLANDIARLTEAGKALYTCMLNERGGVIDDLIAYFLGEGRFRMVVNAATTEKDLAWMRRQAAAFEAQITERSDLALVAVQGPGARAKVLELIGPDDRARIEALKPFHAAAAGERFVSRTGYTGEDGFEVILPGGEAPRFWQALRERGVTPCGLGARDTLRLEAGLNLYGHDMDEETTPLEAGLGWTVAWEPAERDFIGRGALEARRDDPNLPRFVGLVLEGRGVLRDHQPVLVEGVGEGEGVITSGGFSPTLGRAIALARVPARTGERCEVEIRGRRMPVRVVKPPFVRHGKPRVELD